VTNVTDDDVTDDDVTHDDVTDDDFTHDDFTVTDHGVWWRSFVDDVAPGLLASCDGCVLF